MSVSSFFSFSSFKFSSSQVQFERPNVGILFQDFPTFFPLSFLFLDFSSRILHLQDKEKERVREKICSSGKFRGFDFSFPFFLFSTLLLSFLSLLCSCFLKRIFLSLSLSLSLSPFLYLSSRRVSLGGENKSRSQMKKKESTIKLFIRVFVSRNGMHGKRSKKEGEKEKKERNEKSLVRRQR